MHLIDTEKLKLKEFTGRQIPKYAILSHTWDKEEVLYRDMVRGDEATRAMKGYGKIVRTCAKARRHGLEWAWIETCCIDRRDRYRSLLAWTVQDLHSVPSCQ